MTSGLAGRAAGVGSREPGAAGRHAAGLHRSRELAEPQSWEIELAPVPAQNGAHVGYRPEAGWVEGIRCRNGHFCHPSAQYCTTCGSSMLQLAAVRVLDRRPPLGVLVVDDGTIVPLDVDLVIGADPSEDDSVRFGIAGSLAMAGAAGAGLADVHCDLRLRGWNVLIRDRGTEAGTFLGQPNQSWLRVSDRERTQVLPGCAIRIGGRELRFESRHAPLPEHAA